MSELHATATTMVTGRRGILAADESVSTMSKRLEHAGVTPTEENRRAYREVLVTTPGLSQGISGVILSEETFDQRLSEGPSFPDALGALGILPGIKVDTGARPLAGAPDETVTEGLDGLRPRLERFAGEGAKFAKWRAVIRIGGGRPTAWAVHANTHALARYASLCQEAGLVPIVEPEVLMDGDHPIGVCAEVTERVLRATFHELRAAGVDPAGIVLKPNMVGSGADWGPPSGPEEVASATMEVLRASVPDDLAGVAFLSGGQSPQRATANLAALAEQHSPWPLTFSFGRALLDPVLSCWRGDPSRVGPAQRALEHRIACNTAALAASYTPDMEEEHATVA